MKRHPISLIITLILAGLLALTGCSVDDMTYDAHNGQPRDLLSQLDSLPGEDSQQPEQETPQNEPSTPTNGTVPAWTLEAYPDYYAITGKADFTNTTIPATGTITYSQPDQYGRSGTAIGVITKQMRDSGSDRDRDMPDEITGWPHPNPKVQIDLGNGRHYKGYLFNRSHLIAKSLGGEDSAINMVTGTRTQNVGKNQPAGGMARTETEARDWLDDNPNGTITYKATPVYQGTELLPRYVTVDIKTSDGSIDQHVIVYNTANGFDIDYQNGGTR